MNDAEWQAEIRRRLDEYVPRDLIGFLERVGRIEWISEQKLAERINMGVAPMMPVNSRGIPLGESRRVVLFPSAERMGAITTPDFDFGGWATAIFFLEMTVGTAELDLVIEVQDPSTEQWREYCFFDGALTAVGFVQCICDPLAVQGDFDAAKTKVKRVRLPGVIRVKVRPSTGNPCTYSLGATVIYA